MAGEFIATWAYEANHEEAPCPRDSLKLDEDESEASETDETEVVEARPAELDETWEEQPRTKVKTLPLPDRRASFSEIELGFTEDVARREAKRCLRCDLES